jgi:hypothetical protein
MDVQENTKLWANAKPSDDKPQRRETIEVGEIETGSMSLQDKSNLLHSVTVSAQSDLKE